MKKNTGQPLQRSQPQKKPIHNLRHPSKTNHQQSLPKNTNKYKQNLPKPITTPILPKITCSLPSPQQILNKIEQINIQQLNFQQCWNILASYVHQYINFIALFPKSIHDNGHALLADGRFIVAWIKIVGKSGCVNDRMLVKYVEEKFMGLICKNKELVINYFKVKQEQKKQQKTPVKPLLSKESLKRSILKNSQKKVQFGKDQILYPTLDPYISSSVPQNLSTPGQTQNSILSLQQEKNRIRSKHGYLLDYFQINDILLLEQVDVIGILTQLQPYAIVLVKMKSGQKGEKTCIVITKGEVLHEQFTDVFRQIQRSYENLVYLEIYGKNTAEIWVDSLPSQKGK